MLNANFTEQQQSASNIATMETARSGQEAPVFGQTGPANELEASRFPTPTAWNNGTVVLNTHGQLLNGTSSVISIVKSNASAITSQLGANPGFIDAVQPTGAGGNTPEAYLTILFFDERFNFISAAYGGVVQQQVASSVSEGGSTLGLGNIKAPNNGYAMVYVSNRSDQPVYFDNLQVGKVAGNILEENHYYSYGLRIAAISSRKFGDVSEGEIVNQFLYNGKEMLDEDADLGWIDYGFRNYDPQIGRFPQLDPLTDEYPELTSYQYGSNDTIGDIDIDGLEGASSVQTLPGIFVTGVKQTSPTGLSVTGNFLKGFGSSLWGTVTGVASAEVHSIKTVTGIAHAVSHPIQTTKALYGVAKETYNDFKNGNADTKANILGQSVGDIAQLIIGTGEVKAGVKVLRSTKIVREAKFLSNLVNVYNRVMSEAELLATRNNNLLRGGREGENFFSLEGTISSDTKRAQQILKVKFKIKD